MQGQKYPQGEKEYFFSQKAQSFFVMWLPRIFFKPAKKSGRIREAGKILVKI
jgi:hypothetical protein